MHVAITGASSGIGEALAREFSAAGASVSLIARRKDLMSTLAASLKTPTFVKSVDLLDTQNSTAWIAEAEAALGPIDVLINNAGMQIVGPVEETSPDQGEAVLKLDLLTPLRLTIAVLPSMIRRKSGTIVDIASMAAIAPTPGMYHYNAAKGGIAAASEALRGELKGTGVHVVTVYPGPVVTAMAEASFVQYGESARRAPTGTTQGLARLVRYAVEKKRARVIYPRIYAFLRHFPALTRAITDLVTPRLPRAAERARLPGGDVRV
jgi:short-subunit dehydrogenase